LISGNGQVETVSCPRVILTHGEDKARDALRRIIADKHQLNAECPGLNQVMEI
jgi:hypothetical protein